MIYRLARPALFALEPERAHRLALAALARMAAGFDKDAEVPDALLSLGFGFAEVGSITPRAQKGNPRPRLFRLVEDGAVINRMGFNNGGAEAAVARLAARLGGQGVIGINIGANKDAPDWIADYHHMARVMAPHASYLAVNVSSPNTPGLRALQDASALGALLDAVLEARGADGPPVLLKVAPDLLPADIEDIARIAMDRRLGALIVSNTTVSRPVLASRHGGEAGGLSGAPLKGLALETLRAFRRATGGVLPLVGVGGIATADDAWERIRAGASLVQLYSAMIYRGPGIAREILTGLEVLMRRDGFATIAEAVGTE
jgi:dihydroorotate dehydrogenase